MNAIRLLPIGALLAISMALGADECRSTVRKATIPGASHIVVVAEGHCEPRSVGSYSLRVYAGSDPRFPYDDFVAGTLRSRDGTVEDVRFSDLDRDGMPEIIVVIRSAGTGGLLSADAFRVRGNVLEHLRSVSRLPKHTDPLEALQAR